MDLLSFLFASLCYYFFTFKKQQGTIFFYTKENINKIFQIKKTQQQLFQVCKECTSERMLKPLINMDNNKRKRAGFAKRKNL